MKHTRQYSKGRKRGVILRDTYPLLFNSWRGMRSRCNNKNNSDFKWYGGKGIKCCNELATFRGFIEWAITSGYKEGLTIDRIYILIKTICQIIVNGLHTQKVL